MKKTILLSISILFLLKDCKAQLNKLCPISSIVYDKQKLEGMNLLLNTKDCTSFISPDAKTTKTSTVQLIKAAQPFPPLWFQMGNAQADTGGFFETTFLLDTRIQEKSGNLTFFNNYPNKFFGYVTFDTATLQPIDSLTTFSGAPANDKYIIDPHDYRVDAKGNKLIANHVKKKIDARCLSGLEKDSARQAWVNEILILNPADSVIFKWNPLDHLSVCEMNWAYRNSSFLFGDVINWSHVNSVAFANDGNILYSYRHIGVGKINRTTGEVMWKLGGKDTLNSIKLPDTSGYYLQHDFQQRKDGLYSLFSNGDTTHPSLQGIVYSIDEKNKTATMIKRYRPEPRRLSIGMGSYDCNNNCCIISYGVYKLLNPANKRELARILVDDKLVATISAPYPNFSYKVLQTNWTAAQRRPTINLLKNGILSVNTLDGLHDYVWYKIEDNKAIPVGADKLFTPGVSGNYVVEAQQGTGLFKSYLVSDVFTYTLKKN